MNQEIKQISQAMIERYSTRYQELGYHIRTLGWGTEEQQTYRFAQTIASAEIDLSTKEVLDIGCGFGDYAHFLNKNQIAYKKYTGWDINPDLIAEAKKQGAKLSNTYFEVKDIAQAEMPEQPTADIGIMLGLLNLNLKEQLDNYAYSQKLIQRAFAEVKELLIVDFLSAQLSPDYPKEDFVFYHDPVKMLNFALELSPKVVLKHDYEAIPQKEFMLFIYKS